MDPQPDSSRKPNALSGLNRRRSRPKTVDSERLVDAFIRVERRSMRRRRALTSSEAPPSSRTSDMVQALRSTLRRRDSGALERLKVEALDDYEDDDDDE